MHKKSYFSRFVAHAKFYSHFPRASLQKPIALSLTLSWQFRVKSQSSSGLCKVQGDGATVARVARRGRSGPRVVQHHLEQPRRRESRFASCSVHVHTLTGRRETAVAKPAAVCHGVHPVAHNSIGRPSARSRQQTQVLPFSERSAAGIQHYITRDRLEYEYLQVDRQRLQLQTSLIGTDTPPPRARNSCLRYTFRVCARGQRPCLLSPRRLGVEDECSGTAGFRCAEVQIRQEPRFLFQQHTGPRADLMQCVLQKGPLSLRGGRKLVHQDGRLLRRRLCHVFSKLSCGSHVDWPEHSPPGLVRFCSGPQERRCIHAEPHAPHPRVAQRDDYHGPRVKKGFDQCLEAPGASRRCVCRHRAPKVTRNRSASVVVPRNGTLGNGVQSTAVGTHHEVTLQWHI
jgi:hypothetical protein